MSDSPRACRECGEPNELAKNRRICVFCHRERERQRQCDLRADPEYVETELQRARERYHKNPDVRRRKIKQSKEYRKMRREAE